MSVRAVVANKKRKKQPHRKKMKQFTVKIYDAIKRGRTEEALRFLEELANEVNDDQFIKEAILIYSSYNHFKSNYNKGLKNSEEELSIINHKILSVLDNIKNLHLDYDTPITEVKNQNPQIDFSIKERILNSKTVDIISYSCKGILDDYSHHLTESILNGAKVRLIFVKEESIAFKLMMCNTRVESVKNDIQKTKKRIELIRNSLKKYDAELLGNFLIKEITWIPSTNLFLFDNSETRAVVSIKVNPIFYSTPMTERLEPRVIYKKDEPKVFEYYRIQYEHLWKYNDCSIEDFKKQIEYEGRKILEK